MIRVVILVTCVLAVSAKNYIQTGLYGHPGHYYHHAAPQVIQYTVPVKAIEDESPKPYSFAFDSPADGGASAQREVADGSGRVTGSYSLSDADGRQRVVEYYADDTGFHANVKTNEPGTDNQSPADVSLQSAAPAPVLQYAAAPKVVAPAPVLQYAAAPAPVLQYAAAPAPVLQYAAAPKVKVATLAHQHAVPVTYAVAPHNGYYGYPYRYGYGGQHSYGHPGYYSYGQPLLRHHY